MSYFTEPRLSACIVVHQSTRRVLRSVQCFQDSTIELELHMVDNEPGAYLQESLAWQCPGAQYYPQQKNLGSSAAHNLVIPRLRSEYHLICDQDVTFDDHLLEYMVRYMDAYQDCVILMPKMVTPQKEEIPLPKYLPSVRCLLSRRLSHLPGPFKKWYAAYTLTGEEITAPMQVECASSHFMLVRTSALRYMRGFDPRFHLFHEDSDLSRRALEMGQIVYHPDMTVVYDAHPKCKHPAWQRFVSALRYFRKWGWQL